VVQVGPVKLKRQPSGLALGGPANRRRPHTRRLAAWRCLFLLLLLLVVLLLLLVVLLLLLVVLLLLLVVLVLLLVLLVLLVLFLLLLFVLLLVRVTITFRVRVGVRG
jgi:hypothetical protein